MTLFNTGMCLESGPVKHLIIIFVYLMEFDKTGWSCS